MRLASISVDLDEIDCYAAIYGRGQGNTDNKRAPRQGPIYRYAVPRYLSLFAELGVPGTFFAIGRDLRLEKNAEMLRRSVDAGVEIANHSLNHRYDLSRLPKAHMGQEVSGAADLIEAAVGIRPVGFRAPGYTISQDLFEVLRGEGVRYDSSVFPCPSYYGLKTAAIGGISLRAKAGFGRPSHSVVDTPSVLRAPADPYFPAEDTYWKRGAEGSLIELPIGVTRGLRLPYIGTSVVMGTRAADWLTKRMIGRPFVNLELHGIDLSDGSRDGFGELSDLPELKRGLDDKRQALKACVGRLRAAGYQFVTTAKAAELLASSALDAA